MENQKSVSFDDFKKDVKNSPEYKEFEELQNILKQCHDQLYKANQTVINELSKMHFGNIQTGINYDYANKAYTNKLGISHPSLKELTFWPKFTFSIQQNELTAVGEDDNNSTEIYREKVQKIDWAGLQSKLLEYYKRGLVSKQDKLKK